MENLQEILLNNPSLLFRIKKTLEFYAEETNYNTLVLNDKGNFAKSLLNDLDDIEKEYDNFDSNSFKNLKEYKIDSHGDTFDFDKIKNIINNYNNEKK